ncbi:MAG: type II toxin-antitoxin system VapB family antitoxin [Actinobacteria bacterium]|jgi:Arc/MetJ family transcription regulator|nr:type II toxin-antitoxin system VapB family antitoxin [Micrococcales bacterium]MCB0904200.1 type II toxin-antitoxin system VapB family antitoxin [Actinomycetota bacterium]MCO5301465.1 type II toxin-antitoxin system VapB family antitoxin [Candidatus Nanopelagicales bacterium]MCB9428673.1 type II toxin-antitoxin system VapB family antitoxin [Actinomycetota bacterium]HPE11396.1 type II toxin-antitoxin system VapB family antitoxin [Actinomycetota bacterium]
MRTTINIDEELLARAEELTGTHERAALVRRGLTALIAQESARRLALLGGSDPKAEAAPRARSRR